MSKHTPEPWALFEVGDGRPHLCPASESDKMSILTIAEEDWVTFACVYKDSDAIRIVTCVNACAGMADPAAEIAELKRQRDELMVALNKYEEAFDGLFGRCGSNGLFNHWGGRIDCSTLNEAHELSSNATKGPTS